MPLAHITDGPFVVWRWVGTVMEILLSSLEKDNDGIR